MAEARPAERRKHPRHPLATSVQFHHGPSRRDFPGRCVDVSEGGMLMYVPAHVPAQPGHTIRLTVGSLNRPEFEGLNGRPVDATVVRVSRDRLLGSGSLALGVRFLGV